MPDSITTFTPAYEYDPYLQEQLQLQTKLKALEQEEQTRARTLTTIEDRYQGGYMNDAEYLRNYQEIQKRLYMNQSYRLQLLNYLKQNYPNVAS